MHSSHRIYFLSLACFIISLLYVITNILVIAPRYCWGMAEFWLNKELEVGPFFAFATLYLMLWAWALAELALLFVTTPRKIYSMFVLLIVIIFLFALTASHYTLWQTLQVQEGRLTFGDYWIKAIEIETQSPKKGIYENSPSWADFIFEERCGKGLRLDNITDAEYEQLEQKYQNLTLIPLR